MDQAQATLKQAQGRLESLQAALNTQEIALMMDKRNETTKTQTVNALQARIADLKALLASYQNAGTNLAAAQAAQQTRQAQERALQEVENQVQGVRQTSSAVTLSKVLNKQAPAKTTERQLPQTGNDEGLLVSALGMVLMVMVTAFGIQKRKED